MIKNIRHKRILAVLENEGAIETRSLATRIPGVSEVTLRRDIVELAEAGALRRTRGGALPASGYGSASGLHDVKAQRFERTESTSADGGAFHENVDAIILPYVAGRDGDMLRRRILQRGIPFLAESTPQPGGVYLGPDNRAAAHALGVLAATYLEKHDHLRLLIIGQSELSNTRDRVTGFLDGVRHERTTMIDVTQVEGHGSYRIALQAALDAFADSETFDAVFAVNDHSAVAALEAAETIGERPMVFSTGGESAEFIAKVCDDDSPLTAVAAFFPEVVGSIAVDAIAAALQDEGMADRIVTPHALITEHTLSTYYEDGPSGWALRDERLIELSVRTIDPSPSRDRKVIGFMPHYPAHDWYRAMAQTLEDRASRYGYTIAVAPPHQGIADETSRLRREIASVASEMVHPGETIVMGAGEATDHMADLIARTAHASPRRYKDLTVITNALDILYRLDDAPGIKTILTSGEYQASDKCLVGPSLNALFEQIRVDRAFIPVDGITHDFGVSAVSERMALAASRLMASAAQTVALADSTQVGANATYRIARIGEVNTLVTDDGALPSDRQRLRVTGLRVVIADDNPQNQHAFRSTDQEMWASIQPQNQNLGGRQ